MSINNKNVSGVQGFLKALMIYLIINPFFYFIFLFYVGYMQIDYSVNNLCVLAVALSWVSVYYIHKKYKLAILTTSAHFIIVILINLSGLYKCLTYPSIYRSCLTFNVWWSLTYFLLSIIGILYLFKSKRIKNTLINDKKIF